LSRPRGNPGKKERSKERKTKVLKAIVTFFKLRWKLLASKSYLDILFLFFFSFWFFFSFFSFFFPKICCGKLCTGYPQAIRYKKVNKKIITIIIIM